MANGRKGLATKFSNGQNCVTVHFTNKTSYFRSSREDRECYAVTVNKFGLYFYTCRFPFHAKALLNLSIRIRPLLDSSAERALDHE